MKNVVVFVGSRANNGRLNSLIKELQKEFKVHIIGACTLDQIKHDLVLNYYIHADMYKDIPCNRAKTISMITSSMTDWLSFWKMDVAICHGDRFETLGFAIACNYSNVPLVHMEAGEITEVDNDTRWAISALSQFHMTTTFNSYSRMKSMKHYNPYNVGSPIADYILDNKFKSGEDHHVLITYNPTSKEEFCDFLVLIENLIDHYSDIEFKWVNPNIDPFNKMIIEEAKHTMTINNNIEFVKNLSQKEYIQLMADSICIVGNSSSGIREGCVLGIPNLLYGHRQGAREVFQNTLKYYCLDSIIDSFDFIIEDYKKSGLYRYPYKGEIGVGDSSKKVVSVLKEVYR